MVACILNFASGKVSVQLHALDALIPGIGLGGPQSQSTFLEEEKNSLPLVTQFPWSSNQLLRYCTDYLFQFPECKKVSKNKVILH